MSENIGNLNLHEGGPFDHLSKADKDRVINLDNGGYGVVLTGETARRVDTGEIVNITKEEYERYSRYHPEIKESTDTVNESIDNDDNHLSQQRA